MKNKDYCSFFPESWRGKFIGDCCKRHDNACGQAGSYCFLSTIMPFYTCLRAKEIKIGYAITITLGGSVICLTMYPYLLYKKYIYRKGLK